MSNKLPQKHLHNRCHYIIHTNLHIILVQESNAVIITSKDENAHAKNRRCLPNYALGIRHEYRRAGAKTLADMRNAGLISSASPNCYEVKEQIIGV